MPRRALPQRRRRQACLQHVALLGSACALQPAALAAALGPAEPEEPEPQTMASGSGSRTGGREQGGEGGLPEGRAGGRGCPGVWGLRQLACWHPPAAPASRFAAAAACALALLQYTAARASTRLARGVRAEEVMSGSDRGETDVDSDSASGSSSSSSDSESDSGSDSGTW